MNYRVLTDDDVRRVMPMSAAVDRIESALREHAEGTMVAPPRFQVDVEKGSLIFTAGAVTNDDQAVGFRVYDRFHGARSSHGQVVVVFDSDTGDFKGVILGSHLGAMRTGAIGGVAIKHMARSDASRAAILGSGKQARTHLEAAVVVRSFESVKVYSPTATNREAFASEMRETLGLNVNPVISAKEAVTDADVVMCVTKSETPVFAPSWLKPGAHVNTVGPRFQGESELDASIASLVQVVATDSRRQLKSYAKPYFLSDTPWMDAMVELGDIVLGKQVGRQSSDDMTLFCTAGLSGTEVAVASEALRRAGQPEVRSR